MSFNWRERDDETVEYHFNPRLSVPDILELLQAHSEKSASVIELIGGNLDLRYGNRPKQTLDIHAARNKSLGSPAPWLIFMNKAKIGIIGAGWWATEVHIPNLKLRDDVELVSVCKLEEDQLKFVKEKFGFKYASTDFKKMLEFEPLDGVIVSSPHYAHYDNAKAALENNCHVAIEKPMTTNTKDALELFDLAKQKNKEILIPNGFNFTYFMPEAEKLIDDGLIGEVKHIDAAFSSSLVDLFPTLVRLFQKSSVTPL